MAAAAGYLSIALVCLCLSACVERASERTTLTLSTLLLLAFLARISNNLFFFKRLFSAAAALLVISHHHLPIRISTRSFSSSLRLALSSGFRNPFQFLLALGRPAKAATWLLLTSLHVHTSPHPKTGGWKQSF